MDGPCNDTDTLLRRAARGDRQSWGLLLTRHRERLRRMVALRLDQRLQGRIDPSDVLQEVYLEASAHFPDFVRQPAMPFFLWLYGIVGNKMRELHRHHLGTQRRDAGREVSLHNEGPTAPAALAAQLLGRAPEPGEAAMQEERKARLLEALHGMEPLDREVLALRHFEQLTPAETAAVLGINPTAAGMRYVRALRRLRDALASLPGGLTEVRP